MFSSLLKRPGGPDAPLTPRQRDVLQLLAEGRSMKEVGAILAITPRTVAFHKYRMMQDLGLKSTPELIQYAIRHHIISIGERPPGRPLADAPVGGKRRGPGAR